MSNIDFDRFLAKLSDVSEREHIDPARMSWPPTADSNAWYFTPELISIYGTDTWLSLTERQQKRLSFFEAVNFFSMNIHGEKYLVSEISKRLFNDRDSELSRYLLHFVDEESRHMMYFSGFCRRYAGKIYPDRSIHSPDSGDEQFDLFLLFARINIFEEIVDHYNKTMARDERLAPVVREINRIHHVEELRHLAFGRNFLKDCLDRHIDHWDESRRTELRVQLTGYLRFVWKQYYNPNAYTDAGIEDAFDVWRHAADDIGLAERRNQVNRDRLSFLRNLDILEAA